MTVIIGGPHIYIDGKRVAVHKKPKSKPKSGPHAEEKHSQLRPHTNSVNNDNTYHYMYYYPVHRPHPHPRQAPKPKPKPKPKSAPKSAEVSHPITVVVHKINIPKQLEEHLLLDVTPQKAVKSIQPAHTPTMSKSPSSNQKGSKKPRSFDITLSQLSHNVPGNHKKYAYSYFHSATHPSLSQFGAKELSHSESQALLREMGVPVPRAKMAAEERISREEASKRFKETAARYGAHLEGVRRARDWSGTYWLATFTLPNGGTMTANVPTNVRITPTIAKSQMARAGHAVDTVVKKGNAYVGYKYELPSTTVSPMPSTVGMVNPSIMDYQDATKLDPGERKKLQADFQKQMLSQYKNELKHGGAFWSFEAGMEAYSPWGMADQLLGDWVPTSKDVGNKWAYGAGAVVSMLPSFVVGTGEAEGAAELGSKGIMWGSKAVEALKGSKTANTVAKAAVRGTKFGGKVITRIPIVGRTARFLGRQAVKAAPYGARGLRWATGTREGQFATIGAMEIPVAIHEHKKGMANEDILLHGINNVIEGAGFIHGFEHTFPETELGTKLSLERAKLNVGKKYAQHYVPYLKESEKGATKFTLSKYREGMQLLDNDDKLKSVSAMRYVEAHVPTGKDVQTISKGEHIAFAKYYPKTGEPSIAVPGEYRLKYVAPTSSVKNTRYFFDRYPRIASMEEFSIKGHPELWHYKGTSLPKGIWKSLKEAERHAKMGREPYSLALKRATIQEPVTSVSVPRMVRWERTVKTTPLRIGQDFFGPDRWEPHLTSVVIRRPEEDYYLTMTTPRYGAKGGSLLNAGFKRRPTAVVAEENMPILKTPVERDLWARREAVKMGHTPYTLRSPSQSVLQKHSEALIGLTPSSGSKLLEVPGRNLEVFKGPKIPISKAEEFTDDYLKSLEGWTYYGPSGEGKPMWVESGTRHTFSRPDYQKGWVDEFKKGDVDIMRARKLTTPGEQYSNYLETGKDDFTQPYTITDETTPADKVRMRIKSFKERIKKGLPKRSRLSPAKSETPSENKPSREEIERYIKKWDRKETSSQEDSVSERVAEKSSTSRERMVSKTVSRQEEPTMEEVVQKGTTRTRPRLKLLVDAYHEKPEPIDIAIPRPPTSLPIQKEGTNTRSKPEQTVIGAVVPIPYISPEPPLKPEVAIEPRLRQWKPRIIIRPSTETKVATGQTYIPHYEPPSNPGKPPVTVTKTSNLPLDTYIPATTNAPSPPPHVPPIPPSWDKIPIPPVPPLAWGNEGGSNGGAPWGVGSNGSYGYWVGITPFLGGEVPIKGESVKLSPVLQQYEQYIAWLMREGFSYKTAKELADMIFMPKTAATTTNKALSKTIGNTPKLRSMALLNAHM